MYMIIVANRMFVAPEYEEEFEERFRGRARLVDEMPGFIWNLAVRPCKEGDPYVVLTFWESHAHFKDWVNSDAFKEGHARLATWRAKKEAFTQPSTVEIHKVFLDSRRPELVDERGGVADEPVLRIVDGELVDERVGVAD
jgi:heme oxygenase (mycobilin-producing)